MEILLKLLAVLVAALLLLYPMWMYYAEWSIREDDGEAENRVETAKYILVEYQMIEMTKALHEIIRQTGGVSHPTLWSTNAAETEVASYIPLIEHLHGRPWDLLKLKARQAVQENVRRLAWISEVKS